MSIVQCQLKSLCYKVLPLCLIVCSHLARLRITESLQRGLARLRKPSQPAFILASCKPCDAIVNCGEVLTTPHLKMAAVQRQMDLSSFLLFQELVRSSQATIARRRRHAQCIGCEIANLRRKQSRRKAAIVIIVVTQLMLQASLASSNRSVWTQRRYAIVILKQYFNLYFLVGQPPGGRMWCC